MLGQRSAFVSVQNPKSQWFFWGYGSWQRISPSLVYVQHICQHGGHTCVWRGHQVPCIYRYLPTCIDIPLCTYAPFVSYKHAYNRVNTGSFKSTLLCDSTTVVCKPENKRCSWCMKSNWFLFCEHVKVRRKVSACTKIIFLSISYKCTIKAHTKFFYQIKLVTACGFLLELATT